MARVKYGTLYVITALTDCHMRLELSGGDVKKLLAPARDVNRRDEGGERRVVDCGTVRTAFGEVELR